RFAAAVRSSSRRRRASTAATALAGVPCLRATAAASACIAVADLGSSWASSASIATASGARSSSPGAYRLEARSLALRRATLVPTPVLAGLPAALGEEVVGGVAAPVAGAGRRPVPGRVLVPGRVPACRLPGLPHLPQRPADLAQHRRIFGQLVRPAQPAQLQQ